MSCFHSQSKVHQTFIITRVIHFSDQLKYYLLLIFFFSFILGDVCVYVLGGDDNGGGNETNLIEHGKFDRIIFSVLGSVFYVRMLLLNSSSLTNRSNNK